MDTRTISTGTHGRYLVEIPDHSRATLVGFHGYQENASIMFDVLRQIAGPRSIGLVSIQGLHRFYTRANDTVIASWMTKEDRELAIADNVAWVDTVLDRLELEFGAPRAIVFAGFSQGVAMVYRAGLLARRSCAAIVASGGDVPPEMKTMASRPWPRVLAATGARDEWYTPARLEGDMSFVRARRPDARTLVFDGGHEWSDALIEAVGELLAEIDRDANRPE